ncbi:MAG: M23 family metallopeptidase [Chloroflexi bacterium]|nr:M23 family metallopeptidase [Chloroflexota bacterium]MCI0581114.1 M23 family metallopeptidase [Chloroflexota bacterium]MCI0648708.1 M23 family metallopeptidase [Chloroflexota bacterium]
MTGLFFQWPLPYFVEPTQGFGERPELYGPDLPGHDGIDLPAAFGTIVLAPFAGRVFETEAQARYGHRHNYGIHVRVEAEIGATKGSSGRVYQVALGHLASCCVEPGQMVAAGQVVGLVGNTGRVWPAPASDNPTAGTHLHLSLRCAGYGAAGWPFDLVDPAPFFKELKWGARVRENGQIS